jgi:hypothetical protein
MLVLLMPLDVRRSLMLPPSVPRVEGEAAVSHDPAGIACFVRLHCVAFRLLGVCHGEPLGRVHLVHLLHRQREDRLPSARLLIGSGAERAHVAVCGRLLEPGVVAGDEPAPSLARELLQLRRALDLHHLAIPPPIGISGHLHECM